MLFLLLVIGLSGLISFFAGRLWERGEALPGVGDAGIRAMLILVMVLSLSAIPAYVFVFGARI